ncbi:MAG: hypothetical protein QXL34_06590 [Thermosphaera sp.]
MGKIIEYDPNLVEQTFEQIIRQVSEAHYCHPTSITHHELTPEEEFDMYYDIAMGEWLASLENGSK